MGVYFDEHYKNITYPIARNNIGLRNAQLGAIHAIASFFSINNKKKAAITVMPTGAGKTAVLMMAPYLLRTEKILVVTPSAMVRGQIAEDFQGLCTLCRAGVFKESMKKPVVFEMCHKFSEEIVLELNKADVIVATPQCALSLSEAEWAKENITMVEVDEAHHTPAKTWQEILINLKNALHLLYTATPFRLDRKEITGEIIYCYPLSMAYEDGIFGEIKYIPVEESDSNDLEIAKKAEEVFMSDREEGYNHYLMVRTDSKKSAEELEILYSKYTKLNLRRIDSTMSNSKIKQEIQNLREGALDGIICVDMLGEGFDFPNLKIAAIHRPHKSLANTLQFVGRFARTNAENIGTAKFIAVNDENLEIENVRLFSEDAVWQEIIINMSEGKNKAEREIREYYKEYENEEIGDNELSLQAISVNCHDRIYRVSDFDINADFPDQLNIGKRIYRNVQDNTIIGIGIDYLAPLWMKGEHKINKEYSLYIVHYQKEFSLLHIYSPIHTESMYDLIVECFSNKYDKVPKSEMNRVLGNLQNFEIFNSGMLNRHNENGESYRIMAGSDVSDSIDPATGRMFSAGHVFCKANEINGEIQASITIGYSSASKVWSSSYYSIPEYIRWVEQIGKKIANPEIKVKTNTNFDYLPTAERLVEYPEDIFFGEYSDRIYANPPLVKIRGNLTFAHRLTDFDIRIRKIERQKVIFDLVMDDEFKSICECDVDGRYKLIEGNLYTTIGGEEVSIDKILTDNPICFKTYDDTLITGFEIYQGIPDQITFEKERIKSINWEKYNTDTSVEFGKSGINGKISIQDTLKLLLEEDKENKYLIFDHGSGEIADYISVKEEENDFIVKLYHVKKHSSSCYNSNVGDVYEVSGQAVKSLIWLTSKGKLVQKIKERRHSGHCKFVRGKCNDFEKEIRSSAKRLVSYIVIVQPGLSSSVPMADKVQEVLASASSYISRSGKVKGLEIFGS